MFVRCETDVAQMSLLLECPFDIFTISSPRYNVLLFKQAMGLLQEFMGEVSSLCYAGQISLLNLKGCIIY